MVVACSQPARTPKGGAGTFDLDAERRQLTIPPNEQTGDAMKRVEAAAARGDVKAAWAVSHYLIDLFDAARLGRDAEARKALFQLLGIKEASGAVVTNQVIDAILTTVDRVLTIDRLHGGAHAARTLLEHDKDPPRLRSELFARMTALKSVARGGGPLAANGALRLAAFCSRAFRDATTADPPFRPGILAYCLYPLYDSDPDPYFVEDPARRPPEPRWEDLAADLVRLVKGVAGSKSRMAPTGDTLAAEEENYILRHRAAMPERLDPTELKVPVVTSAEPYQWTPLVMLGDGSQMAAKLDLANKIKPRLAQDGRGKIAIVLTAGAPGSAALAAADAAELAGANGVQLVVGYEQLLDVPAGDYWSGRLTGNRVKRLGTLTLALPQAASTQARGTIRVGEWDPARATQRLHLALAANSWQLVTPAGSLPAVTDGDVAALRKQLALILSAYEDEDGIVLVPQAGVAYGDLVTAAVAIRSDETGRPLFRAQALAAVVPKSMGDFEARVQRRAAARATIVPDTLAGKAPAVRRCYQDALDRNAKLAGTYTIRLDGEKLVVTGGPKDPALKKCVLERLGPAVQQTGTPNVKVELGK